VNDKLWWYTARAGGLTAWWLVSIAVLWGLLLSTRVLQGKPKPAWLLDLHRFLGGLSVVFTGVHVAALAADSWVHFGWADVLVPFASDWRPAATAWGIVAMYLLVAVQGTSLLMRKLPRRLWRQVHTTSFGLFLLSGVHAFTAGTDRGNPAVQWTGLLIATAFLFLLAYRFVAPKRHAKASQAAVSA
jgi:predicted ferric reductase